METSNTTRTARTEKFQAKNLARKNGRAAVDRRDARTAREARRLHTDGTFGSDRLPVFGAFGNVAKSLHNSLVIGTTGELKDGE